MTDIDQLHEDILKNILGRLPASAFASASRVSKTWYRLSNKILSRPKLASALSLNPSLTIAMTEVLEKVLSKPIRPHFAIAFISGKNGLRSAHNQLIGALGSKTPLVTHISNGVMGIDALTNELREVQWEYFDYNCPHPGESSTISNVNEGVVLVVGYIPGMKIEAVPFFHPKQMQYPEMAMIEHDKTIREIKGYTTSVSGSEFPNAIMMFGDLHGNVNSIVAKLDNVMPKETAIVGDAGGCFLFNSLNYNMTSLAESYIFDAVALVFAKDKNKSPGETHFHVVMAGGLKPIGPRFEAISVGMKPSKKTSLISAKLEGYGAVMPIGHVLETVNQTVDDGFPDLYIGATQSRYFSMGWVTSMYFYKVTGGRGFIFNIDGVGIRSGDCFMFYHKDMETASTSSEKACEKLSIVKNNTTTEKNEYLDYGVFGGIIFSCHSRGESYFGRPGVDTLPFVTNFPDSPIAGVFCKGEIGHGSSMYFTEEEHQKQFPQQYCSRHACSAVYLTMSYLPPATSNHEH